jgi:hypothetical protein
MDFGQIVTSAWNLTWRQRGLWVLALFAGSASGTCNSGGGSFNPVVPNNANGSNGFGETLSQTQIDQAVRSIQEYLPQIVGALIGIAIVGLFILIPFWLLSIACKAALIFGGAEAAAGRPVPLGKSWRDGSTFRRMLSLELLLFVLGAVVFGTIAAFAAVSLTSQPLLSGAWLSYLFGLLGVVALVGIVASVLGVIVAYAQRAIVLEAAGAIESLRMGYNLVRRNLGNSVILWLIALALSIGGGIALVFGLIVVAIPAVIAGGILALLVNAVGGSGIWALVVVCIIVLFVAALVGGAALNSFLWHFWTVAYLRLTGAWPPAPVPPPESALEPV